MEITTPDRIRTLSALVSRIPTSSMKEESDRLDTRQTSLEATLFLKANSPLFERSALTPCEDDAYVRAVSFV